MAWKLEKDAQEFGIFLQRTSLPVKSQISEKGEGLRDHTVIYMFGYLIVRESKPKMDRAEQEQ